MVVNTTFTNDSATGGPAGGGQTTAGQGKGGALFVNAGATAQSVGAAPTFSGDSASNAGTTTTSPQDNADVFGTLTVVGALPSVQPTPPTPTSPPLPVLEGVQLGRGARRHVRLTTLTLAFNGAVTALPGTFRLVGPGGRSIPFQLAMAVGNSRTAVTLSWGSRRLHAPRLARGRYIFSIDAGLLLDGLARSLASSVGQQFFRLVGDHNADDRGVSNDAHELKELPRLVSATLAELESLSRGRRGAGGAHHHRHGWAAGGQGGQRGGSGGGEKQRKNKGVGSRFGI
jgi:hypothetical protein